MQAGRHTLDMSHKVYNYRIYRNLHKRCWSIQHRTSRGWRLYQHLDSLKALGCTTRVYEAGRQRVLATKKKNVHAYIYAENIKPHGDCAMVPLGKWITYSPYKYPYFYDLAYEDEICDGEKIGKITLLHNGMAIV